MTLGTIKDNGSFACNLSHISRLCKKVKEEPSKVYDLIKEYNGIADTVTRESIFQYVTDKYNAGNYDVVYNAWLGN